VPGSSPRFEARHFVPIYAALNRAKVDFIIIGGQACNLWALMYEKQEPDLKSLRPYTTRDLDVWSGSQKDVTATAEVLHATPRLNDPTSSAPDMGHFTYRSQKGNLLIQFLTGAYGVRTDLVIRSRQNYSWKTYKLNLSVMHPLLSLEAKLGSFYGLDQTGRQDLKHLKMALLYTPAFIIEKAKEGKTRDVLRMCQHILALSASVDGLRLYREKRLAIDEAIPVHGLGKIPDEKINKFLQIQLPRERQRLQESRP
jgi:hypothetical protein